MVGSPQISSLNALLFFLLIFCQSSHFVSSPQYELPLTRQLPRLWKPFMTFLQRVGYTLLTAPWTFPVQVLFSSQIQSIWKLTQHLLHQTDSVNYPLVPSMIPPWLRGSVLKINTPLGVTFSLSRFPISFHNICFICLFLSIPPAQILTQNFLITSSSQTPIVSWICRLFFLIAPWTLGFVGCFFSARIPYASFGS